jgi:hypothetical protein
MSDRVRARVACDLRNPASSGSIASTAPRSYHFLNKTENRSLKDFRTEKPYSNNNRSAAADIPAGSPQRSVVRTRRTSFIASPHTKGILDILTRGFDIIGG